MVRDMGLALKCGLMELSMRENGLIIKLMEEESSGMLMAMFMKETGRMIRPMGMEHTYM